VKVQSIEGKARHGLEKAGFQISRSEIPSSVLGAGKTKCVAKKNEMISRAGNLETVSILGEKVAKKARIAGLGCKRKTGEPNENSE